MQNQKGFTLAELILYIATASILLAIASAFFSQLLQVRTKARVIAEVEQQGLAIMQLITQTIRNAEKIETPNKSQSGVTLELVVPTGENDPTIFSESNDTLTIQEGSDPAIDLTNSHVEVSNLLFENVSYPGTPGTVHVEFTLSSVNPENRTEFEYSQTFYGSATIRQ